MIGATSLIRRARHKPEAADPHLLALLARKPACVASVAMANKMARVVWAIMARGETYQARHVPLEVTFYPSQKRAQLASTLRADPFC